MDSVSVVESEQSLLLREVVELLVSEIALISNRKWDEVPEFKKRKVLLASRLRSLSAHDRQGLAEAQSLISDLEEHSHLQIKAEMEQIGNEIASLQELRQYWAECLNVSLRKYC